MSKLSKLSRRNYLRNSVFSAGSVFFAGHAAKAASCLLTPEQTEGPFYPISDQADKDNDLTSVKNKDKKAEGEVIIMTGIVSDEKCQPIEGVLVEIWQACVTGKYNHPSDPNPAELDPNFQYWGRAITNAKGEYSFKTIRPGQYQATANWMRPSHIHLKAQRRGYEELTTQVYFKDDPYNSKDRILQSLSPEERQKVVVDFREQKDHLGKPTNAPRVGSFNITIKPF